MAAALGVRSDAGRTPEGTSSKTCRKCSVGHFRAVARIVRGYAPGIPVGLTRGKQWDAC